ncbi:hypothetical protein IJF86_01270 [Candidatus Saccharibacteria bacterium]|nr:hypothetical protein [Candidatus Saccharibacteria bacterium]
MANKFKKSGQKIAKRLSRFSRTASREGRAHLRENFFERISHIHDVRLLVLEWSLLVLVVILLAIVQSVWYADSYSVSSFEAGGSFTEATLGRVNSLNPLFASTNSEKALAKLLFSSLAENDYSGHVGCGLAQSITSDDSGKVWTVHLRENLVWSDGEPLTNSDVLFTVNLIKNPAVFSVYSSGLAGVSVVENESGDLVFSLASPYVDFDSALVFPVLPEHILSSVDPALLLESDFSQKPISSGAFSFNATQPIGSSGESIVYLSANKNYYKGAPMLNSFAIHAFLDIDSIVSALNSGSVTATAELPPVDRGKITSNKIYELQTAVNSGVFAFINTKSPTLSDKSLRQAIQQGVSTTPLKEIASSHSGLAYPILPSQADTSSWLPIPDYNPVAAKTVVSDAGITPDADVAPLSVVTINSGALPAVAEQFAAELRELGFSTEVSVYDPSQEFNLNIVGARNYDILIYEVELGASPELFAYYHSSQASSSGLNFSNYANAIVNDLILATRSTTNESLRNAKYSSFLRYWVSDVPAIALYQSNISYFYNKNTRVFPADAKLVIPTDRFNTINYWAAEKTSLNRTP